MKLYKNNLNELSALQLNELENEELVKENFKKDLERKKQQERESAIKRQTDKGKLLAHERLGLLLDKGSFVEYDKLVQHRCSNFGMTGKTIHGDGVITGSGTINGRKVFVYAQDFTEFGGSLGEVHAEKICKIMDMAVKYGKPVIGLNDSGGARIQEGLNSLEGYAKIFYRNVQLSGVVPQISAILGPCAGGAVYSPAITDFVFMVDKISQMFVTGPDVVKIATGEDVSFDELGGVETHTSKSGVAHFNSASEIECFEQIRTLLSFLPDNNLDIIQQHKCTDPVDRDVSILETIIPESSSRPYEMHDIISVIFDNEEFFEIQENFAKNIITGFARLNGHSVGVVANQTKVLAGTLNIDASIKAARFVRFCDSFNIPLITLVDVPGFLPGKEQEQNGIIRNGAKLLYAYAEATVPKITLITRKAYGGAYIVLNCKHLGADFNFAWPNAETAVMGSLSAINIIYKKELTKNGNNANFRNKLVNDYKKEFANPYAPAKRGYIDDIIEPSDTRIRLIEALETSLTKRVDRPKRKHGNIPL